MKTLLGKELRSLGTLILAFNLVVLSLSAAERVVRHEQTLLLAREWNPSVDPTGWWVSEKCDGMRARWDGSKLWSRGGNEVHAPIYFLEELPNGVALDGELWMGRGRFEETVSVARRLKPDERWRRMKYMIFDAPKVSGLFETRLKTLRELLSRDGVHLRLVQHTRCKGMEDLIARRDKMVAANGEGLMIRRPASEYETGYSATLLKVKPHSDGVATVIGHNPGKGRYEGMLGSLRVRTDDGREFSIGTRFKGNQRKSPPAVGMQIEYRFRGLTKKGLPRFPSFLRIRKD